MKQSIIIFVLISFLIISVGCIEGETSTEITAINDSTTFTETPAINDSTTSTLTENPTAAQIITPDLDVMLKPGYVLYQNNEYSYGFGYPEDWGMVNVGLSDNMLQGVGMSHDTTGNGSIIVVVYSSDPKLLWDEMGGLDKLIELGYIMTARNTTVNGRVAFEVVPSETFMPGSIVRYVIIQANGYYYMMTLWGLTSDETYSYSTQPDKFDDIVNSWVIGNIE